MSKHSLFVIFYGFNIMYAMRDLRLAFFPIMPGSTD